MDESLWENFNERGRRRPRIALGVLLIAMPFIARALGPHESVCFAIGMFYIGTAILLKSRVILCAMLSLLIGALGATLAADRPYFANRSDAEIVSDLLISFGFYCGLGALVGWLLDQHHDESRRSATGRDQVNAEYGSTMPP
jgi:hypothetical protein